MASWWPPLASTLCTAPDFLDSVVAVGFTTLAALRVCATIPKPQDRRLPGESGSPRRPIPPTSCTRIVACANERFRFENQTSVGLELRHTLGYFISDSAT